VNFLIEKGVKYIFEVPGGATTHILDSIYKNKKIDCFTTRHEQTASFAAEAIGKLSRKIGVAMATSGPGATNMITGIGSAYFDSSPTLFITGQVNTYEFNFKKKSRQLGFQETDIITLVKPITKHVSFINEPATVKYEFEKAVYLAENGRPGPVLIDIPMNIQRADIDSKNIPSFFDSLDYNKYKSEYENFDTGFEDLIIELLKNSKRPVILAGHGINLSGANKELAEISYRNFIPVVTSLMGIDSIIDSELHLGLIGTYGNRFGNLALANTDLLIAIGTRLDLRQTGNDTSIFAREATIVHVDIDKYELNHRVKAEIAIRSDAKIFLKSILDRMGNTNIPPKTNWLTAIRKYKNKYPSIKNYRTTNYVNPNLLLEKIYENVSDGSVLSLDVGQNQIWAAQSYKPKNNLRVITSGGMGAMGYALPASIGAATFANNGNVLCISGDGGIQMNIQELETIKNKSLPIKIFVLNNKCLGMVRQFQDFYFEERNQSTVVGYSAPSFTDIAKAYNIDATTIESNSEIDSKLKKILNTDNPVLADVKIDSKSSVEPKLLVNEPIEDQHPYIDEQELKDSMFIKTINRRGKYGI